MTHQKKTRGHRTSKIVKSTQSYSNAIIVHFTTCRARSMRDVACEFRAQKDAQKQLARTSLNHTRVIALLCPKYAQPGC